MWKRAERLVQPLNVPEEQKEVKKLALEGITKGKEIVHERAKLIRFADRDGWKAALHYLGDNIAETEAEGKKMRKSKKETEKEKEADRTRRERKARDRRNRGDGQGSSRDRDSRGRYGQASGYSTSGPSYGSTYGSTYTNGNGYQTKYCYLCKRTGHIARFCPY